MKLSPYMGWNSYDYYDTTVTEADIKVNAEYMAKNLKEFGWEYIVADIEWYSYGAGSRRAEHHRKAALISLSGLPSVFCKNLVCISVGLTAGQLFYVIIYG